MNMTQFFTRTLKVLAVAAATLPFAANAQDAYLSNFGLPRYTKAGVAYSISVWCRNTSSTAYTSCSVYWRLDGGTTHTMPTTNIGGGGVVSGNYLPITHPDQMTASAGNHTLEVWINTTTDTDPSNNMLTIDFTALSTWADKVVLLEARTETWCPQCPSSNTVTNSLMTDPDYAVAKFHLSDALDDCSECITYYNQHGISYTPAGIIEMGEYDTYAINYNHSGWAASMASKATGVSPVELTMTSSVNWTTRVMTVTISAEFTYAAITGPFNLNVYVMEDNVPGPQSSAPSGYIHHKVMRAMLGGSDGTGSVVPNSPVAGTAYSHTYSYTVPAGYKIGDLQLVGVLEHKPGGFNDRYSLNAVKSAASPVGIAEQGVEAALFVSPNPFRDNVVVRVPGASGAVAYSVIGIDGRGTATGTVNLDANGSAELELSGLVNGYYLLRLFNEGVSFEQRVLKAY
jgi:hypothetical protein